MESPNGSPKSEEAFNDALRTLINDTRENDVNVLGAWECRTGENGDYEAVIAGFSERWDD